MRRLSLNVQGRVASTSFEIRGRAVGTSLGIRLLCAAAAGCASIALAAPASATRVGPDPVVGGQLLASPGIVASLVPGITAPPAAKASSYVIGDLDTGEILAAKNAHGRFAPASTLKTLTALTFIPRLPPSLGIQATNADAAVDGTKVGVVPGQWYSADSLFKAMLMMSANDAAMTVATSRQSLPTALRLMNAESARLQALDTVAKTPNGLDARGQTSSAYDLALISRAALNVPAFRTYVATKRSIFPAPHHKHYQIYTHDHLLLNYRGAFGVKNGYTVAAQASFVGAATRGGHRLIVALMHGEPDLWKDAAHLLDWGFRADGVVTPVGQFVDPVLPTASATVAPAVSHTGALARHSSKRLHLPLTPMAAGAGVVVAFGALRLRSRRRYRQRSDGSRSKFSLPPI
jgi:D-alanyl-D-alanine carboxypeptidase (penicillin-binding protein 5/6)